MKRAFRTTLFGITSIVAASSPAQAKAITVKCAREVYDRRQINFTDVRVVRAPEFDDWAEVDGSGHCWGEKELRSGLKKFQKSENSSFA